MPFAALGRIIVLFVASFGSAGFVFLTQTILVRLLSLAEYGQFVALLAFINLMTPVSLYGVGWFWLRTFGEEGWKAFRWLKPSIRLLTLTCTTASCILIAYTWYRFDAVDPWMAGALAIPVLLGQFFAETTSARLQLEERFIALAIWQSLTQTGRFLVAIGLRAIDWRGGAGPLVGYALLGGLLAAIGLVSLRQMSQGHITLRGHGRPPLARRAVAPIPSLLNVVRESTPFCLWTIFYLLYYQSVVILLAALVGKPAAGIFNVAFQIITAAHLVPHVIYTKYLLGKVFRWAEHDTDRFFAAFHFCVIGMPILGLSVMALVIVASPVVVPILFGNAYAESVPITIALSVTIPARFLQTAHASLFFSKENMKHQVGYGGIAAFFCVSLNMILLPRYGLTGAVITQIATELLLLALYVRGVQQLNTEIRLWHSFRPATFLQAFKRLSAASAE